MLLGKLSGIPLGSLAGSAPKSSPNDASNLDPVVVTVQPRNVPPPTEDIPEIVVEGRRIPWYVWLGVGVIGFAAVSAALRK